MVTLKIPDDENNFDNLKKNGRFYIPNS